MEISDILKEMTKNQKMLAISALIHFPLVYTGAFYLFPEFRTIDFFPQVMIATSFTFALTFIESGIALPVGKINPDGQFQLFPLVWVSMVTFFVSFLFFLGNCCSLLFVVPFYILTLLGSYWISRRIGKKRHNETQQHGCSNTNCGNDG